MKKKAIYELICEHIKDGKLDDDFSLPVEDEERMIWAPGAMDGVYIYHMIHPKMDEDEFQRLADAITTAANIGYKPAEKLFYQWTKDNQAITAVDDLQQFIIDHSDQLDARGLLISAINLVTVSSHVECVKIGLEIFELFDSSQEGIKDIVQAVGLCDEFTIFAVWCMQRWDDGNQEIFELAKKVDGWGRIHAIEKLEPETDEIRKWLLTEGCSNGVMSAYSALTCWNKSGAEKVLFGEPTAEEYNGLSDLIYGLLDEGPVEGISAIENAEEVLLRFLEISAERELSVDQYEVILNIKRWSEYEDEGNLPSVVAEAEAVLNSSKCRETVIEAVKHGDGLELAIELEIPYHEQLYKCLQEDFDRLYFRCGYLMNNPDYVEPVLNLFKEKLPLSEMEGEPEDGLGLGPEFEIYNKLDFILQELDTMPMVGLDFMYAGLRSPIVRNRNRALSNLKSWVELTQTSLSDLSPELYEELQKLRVKEVSEGPLSMIIPLLAGRTEFDDEEYDEEDDEE